MRPLRFVSWGVLLATIAFSVAVYDDLPVRIPMHLGFGGQPGNFQPRELWSWFLLPASALLVQVLLTAIAAMLPTRPHLFNFPEKDRFLALPKERQAPVIREMVVMMDATAIGIQALMLLVVLQLWEAANGIRSTFGFLAVPISALLLTPVILLLVARVSAAVKREETRR